jgi:DNA-3-methyladenine glycosylase II
MHIFRYGEEAIDHLRKRDKKLGRAIEAIGPVERGVNPDLFSALVSSVAAQQVSAKAAGTICNRMVDRFGAITPEIIAPLTAGELRQCGLSLRKARYIQGIGSAVAEGRLDLPGLRDLPDEEVIRQLTALDGVGTWTAEMILIFSLERPDVVSRGDLAIRRGMMRLYGHAALGQDQFERYRKRYSPYGTVASLYLWEISHQERGKVCC